MADELYAVRQYRPAYVTGFKNSAFHNVKYDDILKLEFFNNFKHEYDGGFDKFVIEPYSNELIISAHYKNGKHWVAGFAVKESDPFSKDWRYQDHES